MLVQSRIGWNYVYKSHNKSDRKKKEKEKRKVAEAIGKIDSSGRVNWNVVDERTWEDRKRKIMEAINSGIDQTKRGWMSAIARSSGLTKSIVQKTVIHFKEDFKL